MLTRMPVWGWGIVAMALMIGVIGTWTLQPPSRELSGVVMKTVLDVTEGEEEPLALAASGSGALLAFSDGTTVYIRDMKTEETWTIPETADIERLLFSKDENWLFMEKSGSILRSPIRGGSPSEVASVAARYAGVNIVSDSEIVYESGREIWIQDLAGGDPELAIQSDSTIWYDDPFLTPDKKSLLVRQFRDGQTVSNLGVYDYPSGKFRGETDFQGSLFFYLDTGHLVYQMNESMYASPIDLNKVELSPIAVPLGERVMSRAFSVTSEGHLFFAAQSLGSFGGMFERHFKRIAWNGSEGLAPHRFHFCVKYHTALYLPT